MFFKDVKKVVGFSILTSLRSNKYLVICKDVNVSVLNRERKGF